MPISVYLNEEDPKFKIKLKYNNYQKSKTFRVDANLDNKIMSDFISWIRMVEFDDDEIEHFFEKDKANGEARIERY